MITTLLLVLLGLIILLWLAVMALWQQQENERAHPTLDAVALRQVERVMRMTRRSYYGSLLYSNRAFNWGNGYLRRAFIRVFPKAASAFEKRDILTGLAHGPSSYFLHSITREEKEKSARRTRKIV